VMSHVHESSPSTSCRKLSEPGLRGRTAPDQRPSIHDLYAHQAFDDAKRQTQREERRIALLVPGMQKVDQQKQGTVFACGDGTYQWIGGTKIALASGTDEAASIAGLKAALVDDDRYQLLEDNDINGDLRLDMRAEDGEGYLLASGTGPESLEIISAAKCFTLPETFSHAGGW
jgi:hypothetical protein